MQRPDGPPAGFRVVVVGGGFSGATFAVQLLCRTRVPVHISIVESRAHLGRGMAYSAIDPDHRLNGPLDGHAIDPAHPDDLLRWCDETRVRETDPEGGLPSGHFFLRRSVLGEYLSEQVALHARGDRLGSSIGHVQDTAVDVVATGDDLQVRTSAHGNLAADLVVLATGNPPPSLRRPFLPEHAHHPGIVASPLEPGSLDVIPTDARVLVVGSGLTALDVLSTLLRRGHRGPLVVVSRHGLRPRGQPPEVLDPATPRKPPVSIIEKVNAPIPAFIACEPPSVRRWCRALRREIARVERAGGSWQEPFDAVRDVVWKLWPQLPLAEQQRFLRRLRRFYDVHRFRTPPMNEEITALAEREGRVRHLAARVIRVVARPDVPAVHVDLESASGVRARHAQDFDCVVNCTGLDSGTPSSGNPLLARLESRGMLTPHGTGLGYEVSASCAAIDTKGRAQPCLRVIGPPTAGAFGDPLGALFIAAQVDRILPDVMLTLAGRAAPMLQARDRHGFPEPGPG